MATLNTEKVKEHKRKRVQFSIFISIIEIFFAIEVTYLIHQILLYKSFKGLNYSYWNAVIQLLQSEQMKGLFILIEFLWLAFLIYLSLTLTPTISEIDVMHITSDIAIPVPAGNGQHGKERFLTEAEKEKLFEVFEYSGSQVPDGKGGVVVQMKQQHGKEYILYMAADLHTLIIGTSGAGKTRRILLETIWLQLLTGLSAVVNDVKGELFYYTSDYAKMLGYEVWNLDFRNPKKSMHYNFLQPILQAIDNDDLAKAIDYVWDLVSVLVGQQKGEPIWYNGECASIAAGILAVAIDAPREYANLTNVYYFLAYMCKADQFGEMPLSKYLDKLADTHPAKGVFAQAEVAPYKTRSSFFTSALGTLRLFTNPNVAEMTGKSDMDFKEIGKKKTVIYLMIPDEKKTLYPLVSMAISQMYALQMEVANENGLMLPVNIDYDLDEVGNIPYIPILGMGVSAGRSRGIRFNLVIQDYQQLESKYKDEYKTIMTNCQMKLYLKSDDSNTLKMVSENLGKYTVEVSSASSSVSGENGRVSRNNMNFSSSAALVGRPLLEPAEIKRIKIPYSICMVTGEYAGINILPDLSSYRLNELLGLGDEDHNNQLIVQRESQRKEHIISQPALWGIWKQYLTKDENSEGIERVSFLN